MDAAGGPEDRAMSCAITTTPATSPGRGYNYYAGPGYYDSRATATADQGSPFAAGSPLGLPVPAVAARRRRGGDRNEG